MKTPHEAMQRLLICLQEILEAGYTIHGINPAKVIISKKRTEPSQQGACPNTPRGFDGDISTCCGAPAERKGTCLYCTACGESNGCS